MPTLSERFYTANSTLKKANLPIPFFDSRLGSPDRTKSTGDDHSDELRILNRYTIPTFDDENKRFETLRFETAISLLAISLNRKPPNICSIEPISLLGICLS